MMKGGNHGSRNVASWLRTHINPLNNMAQQLGAHALRHVGNIMECGLSSGNLKFSK